MGGCRGESRGSSVGRSRGGENFRVHGKAYAEQQPAGVHDQHPEGVPQHGGGFGAVVVGTFGKTLEVTRFEQREKDRVAEAEHHGTREQEAPSPRTGGAGNPPGDDRQENSHHDPENRTDGSEGSEGEDVSDLHHELKTLLQVIDQ